MSDFIVDCFDDTTSLIVSRHRVYETILIRGIRLEMFKSGFPTGSVFMEIYVDGILNETQELTFEEINSEITATYAHGYLHFELDNPVFISVDNVIGNKEMELRFYTSGYTYSNSVNFGIIKRHNNKIVSDYGIDYASAMDEDQAASHAPYSIEIYEII